MGEWLSGLAGGSSLSALAWVLAALALFVLVLLIVRLLRGRRTGTFVAGGRHRVPRLNVVDATAVDDHRRLVLVRRDDVEHLILIGGPTDVVVEQAIVQGDGRRAAMPPVQRARAATGPQHPRSEPEMTDVSPAEEDARPAPEIAAINTAPRERRSAPAARQDLRQGKDNRQTQPPAYGHPTQPNLRTAEERPARTRQKAPVREPDVSIEEEMSRLLEDLKNE